jgi:hypothetical protein
VVIIGRPPKNKLLSGNLVLHLSQEFIRVSINRSDWIIQVKLQDAICTINGTITGLIDDMIVAAPIGPICSWTLFDSMTLFLGKQDIPFSRCGFLFKHDFFISFGNILLDDLGLGIVLYISLD